MASSEPTLIPLASAAWKPRLKRTSETTVEPVWKVLQGPSLARPMELFQQDGQLHVAVEGELSFSLARLLDQARLESRPLTVDQALPESGRISGPLVARPARLAGTGRIASGR